MKQPKRYASCIYRHDDGGNGVAGMFESATGSYVILNDYLEAQREIKKLKDLLEQAVTRLPYTNCGELRIEIKQALK
jgi:hypothetical protein